MTFLQPLLLSKVRTKRSAAKNRNTCDFGIALECPFSFQKLEKVQTHETQNNQITRVYFKDDMQSRFPVQQQIFMKDKCNLVNGSPAMQLQLSTCHNSFFYLNFEGHSHFLKLL